MKTVLILLAMLVAASATSVDLWAWGALDDPTHVNVQVNDEVLFNFMDSVPSDWPEERGLHLVTLKPSGDAYVVDQYEMFGLYGSADEGEACSDFIMNLPEGTIIIAASAGAIQNNHQACDSALQSIGVDTSLIQDRSSLAFVAKKGDPEFITQESALKREGPINLSMDLPSPPSGESTDGCEDEVDITSTGDDLDDLALALTVSDVTSAVFKLKTCKNAKLFLAANSDVLHESHRFTFGGWSNSKSVIKDGDDGPELAIHEENGLVDCDEFRDFWVSWEDDIYSAGKGKTVGENEILRLENGDEGYNEYDVHYVYVTSNNVEADWVFNECETEEEEAEPTDAPVPEYSIPPECLLDLDEGSGDLKIRRWGWVDDEGRCAKFFYKGNAGNDNHFTSKQACRQYCKKWPGWDNN